MPLGDPPSNKETRLMINTAMTEHSFLRLEHISKSFPGVQALDDVHFEMEGGEIHALVGENGAGKSTLMKILTGAHHRDSGTIIYKGTPLEVASIKEAQEAGIGIVYQEFNLMPHLTVAQNIFITKEPRTRFGTLDEKELNRRASEVLRSLNLTTIRPSQKLSTLSVAEKQMVEIVKAVWRQVDLMIMDEPTSALTTSEIEQLFKTIRELRSRGVGVIYISHRLEELKDIADRITIMRDGKYVKTMTYSETTTEEIVGLMVGRKLSQYFPERTPTIGEKILEVRGLNRDGVLRDISFDLRQGEILGIAGLMGAGRTELARAVFGADDIDCGEIYVDGIRRAIRSPLEAIRSGIGYLTEDRKRNGLALKLSVRDNIIIVGLRKFTAALGMINYRNATDEAERLVQSLNVKTPSLSQKVGHLSGGNQQKVIIARWLCGETRILIFDEPTRGIDVGAKQDVYQLMNRLVLEGHSIIMISSELPEILGMSDRVLVMHEGSVAGVVQTAETSQEEIMRFATGGK
ncbi:MAG: sugar ABC transporter ATP-binding protein [Alkalispirochaeta sp.]